MTRDAHFFSKKFDIRLGDRIKRNLSMAALSEYTNVYNTALLLLQKKKEGWDFMSDSPCGLFGLIGIFELKSPSEYSEYWWREDGPNIYRTLAKQPRPYDPVWKKP
jgi:hypothetical protein